MIRSAQVVEFRRCLHLGVDCQESANAWTSAAANRRNERSNEGQKSACSWLETSVEQWRSDQPSNSRSNSLRCRWTISSSNFDTDGLPPYCLARVKATLFKSSQISAGRLIPVVRWVRSTIAACGFDRRFGGFSMSALSLAHFAIGNSDQPLRRDGLQRSVHMAIDN
jgi:hypothetical protein